MPRGTYGQAMCRSHRKTFSSHVAVDCAPAVQKCWVCAVCLGMSDSDCRLQHHACMLLHHLSSRFQW